ncbi:MAG: hypothetical protein OXB97_03260 [Rhodospirillales bacterium]|nr:hypothetical protein [Rhodospirillales bacterium]
MAPLVYAGVGARKTPAPVRAVMRRMAWYLAEKGWHLNTGGADGADTAFVEGSPALCTVFLPWEGYNGWTGPECVAFGDKALAKLQPFAAAHPDARARCSPAVRKLHARNVAVIGCAGVTEPVSAVVCWTEDGRVEGGTGLAIRLAESVGIPVFTLASVHPRDVCIAMNRIARKARAGDGG